MKYLLILLLLVPCMAQTKPCHGKKCRSVTLRWQASETPGVTAYAVYRNGKLVFKGQGYSWLDQTVQAGQIYTYQATTFVFTSESAPSNAVSVAIP